MLSLSFDAYMYLFKLTHCWQQRNKGESRSCLVHDPSVIVITLFHIGEALKEVSMESE